MFNLAIKKVFCVLISFGAVRQKLHDNKRLLLLARCFAGSGLLSVKLCSDQRSQTLRIVSPMQVSTKLILL